MTSERRTVILRRIPSLEENIISRNLNIRYLEEDLETLTIQRAEINEVLNENENLSRYLVDSPRGIPEYAFRGENRNMLDDNLVSMSSAVDSQRSIHTANQMVIGAGIKALQVRIVALRTSNSADQVTISDLRTEWRAGNQNMEFPRFIV